MLPNRIYPSKVILLGEYTVIQDSAALAVPVHQFSGQWQQGEDDSQRHIHALAKYLSSLQSKSELHFQLDEAKLATAMEVGFFLDSNIPFGYGLGSSGALCAAIYDAFAIQKTEDWTQLKAIFAQMESYFHGSSSGTDPLICYLNRAVHLRLSGIEICKIPSTTRENEGFFLLNSCKARKSEAFINWFVEQCKQEAYLKRLKIELIPTVEDAIARVLGENDRGLLNLIHQISYFQQQHFQAMLLPALDELWQMGLDSDYFKLKICGAGGGGFFLGYTSDWRRLQGTIRSFPISRLTLPSTY